MTRRTWVLLILFSAFPFVTPAQQTAADKSLNNTQKLGQRDYQQRCGVCHSQPNLVFPMYGPALYQDLVIGNEDAIRQFIREGSSRMPGFKLGLQPSEIDAIVEYLKTVAKPAKPATPAGSAQGQLD